METPGVIIDACVPRSPYERCVTLYAHLICMEGVIMDDRIEALDPGHAHTLHEAGVDIEWEELEDELIHEINTRLPDSLVCTLGEFQPGDVVVREVQSPDDEMAAM